MKKKKVIILAAGGTGGHFYPAIALAEKLYFNNQQIYLFTDERCAKYITEQMPITPYIAKLHFKNNNLLSFIQSRLMLIFTCLQTIWRFIKLKPAIIVGFGGYPSVPSLLAATLLNIPLIIHEQNAFLGRANRVFIRFAKYVTLAYENTANIPINYQSKTIVIGDVLRQSVTNLAKKKVFNDKVFHLFIFGGSQGAEFFTHLLPATTRIIKEKAPGLKFKITQQLAVKFQPQLTALYQEQKIECNLQEFFHNIQEIYLEADLVIARAGAGTIGELANIGLPAIFIPYPQAADNHQLYNAKLLSQQQASWYFEQQDVTATILAELIIELAIDRSKLVRAAKQLLVRKTQGVRSLADIVATII